jgi:Na+/H+ antiporter NhaA
LTIYLFIYFLLREKKIKTFKFFFVVGVLVWIFLNLSQSIVCPTRC